MRPLLDADHPSTNGVLFPRRNTSQENQGAREGKRAALAEMMRAAEAPDEARAALARIAAERQARAAAEWLRGARWRRRSAGRIVVRRRNRGQRRGLVREEAPVGAGGLQARGTHRRPRDALAGSTRPEERPPPAGGGYRRPARGFKPVPWFFTTDFPALGRRGGEDVAQPDIS